MAQNDFGTINPNTKSGTDLASDLNDFRDAQNTNHNGSTQPSYVQTWMTWLDSTAANGVMKIYDGTDDVPVYVVDATNNVARVALDNDEDTYIVSSTDDQMDFYSSASVRMSLTATFLTMSVPIDMNGSDLQFSDDTGINDANGNEVVRFQTVTSAVNYFDLFPSATGNGIDLQAAGGDTNIDILITPKGTGQVKPGETNFADNELIRPKIKDYGEAVNALGDLGGGTDDIDLTAGNVVTATVSTSTQTFTFSNPPASGTAGSFTLILTNGGSQTVNWPASVDWAGGTAPTLTSAGVDVLTFITTDGGTTWYGFAAGLDMQ